MSHCEAVAETGDSACCFFSRALGCNIKVGANRSQDASDSAFATECKLQRPLFRLEILGKVFDDKYSGKLQRNLFRLEILGNVFDEYSGSCVLLTFCCFLGMVRFLCGIKKDDPKEAQSTATATASGGGRAVGVAEAVAPAAPASVALAAASCPE